MAARDMPDAIKHIETRCTRVFVLEHVVYLSPAIDESAILARIPAARCSGSMTFHSTSIWPLDQHLALSVEIRDFAQLSA